MYFWAYNCTVAIFQKASDVLKQYKTGEGGGEREEG
jgi:hypothetical protein